jgi:signal transduction histidine kinase
MKGGDSRRLRLGRIESLAALAGGMTHELANLSASVLLAVDLLEPCCRDAADRATLAALGEVAGRVQRAGRQFHWLARGVAGEPTVFLPNHLLVDLQRLAAATFPPAVTVATRYAADLWPVAGHPLLVYQLLLALALEGRDRLPAAGGTLVLGARNETRHEGGRYVVLEALAEPAAAPLTPAAPATSAGRRRAARAVRQAAASAGATVAPLVAVAPLTAGCEHRATCRRTSLPAADL